MNKLYVLFILILVSSCKKNNISATSANAAIVDTTIFGNVRIKIDTAYINKFKDKNLKEFYENYNNEIVWHSKDLRREIIDVIYDSQKDGLLPSDYNINRINEFENQIDDLSDNDIVEYDLLLTRSLQALTKHISKGKINPKTQFRDVDLKEKVINVNEILYKSIDDKEIKIAIENCKSKHPIYQNIKKAYEILNAFPEDNVPYIEANKKIKPGTKSPTVVAIKKRLMYWNDMKKDSVFTNDYNKETVEAVKTFQWRHGLFPDGIIGTTTFDALNATKTQRIQQLRANLERWKWYASEFEKHYILVNIADYTLVVVKNNDTMRSHRVVVGKTDRKTPILSSKLNNILLNPNWTVPPTILREDIYPDAQKNRNAFKKKGLVILDYKNREVSPYKWKLEDAKKYKYVQNPGYNNALGSVKLNFPNRFSVYMHDTNHRDFFKYSYRSLSSGCVRIDHPLEMAEYILNNKEKWSLKTIRDTTRTKNPKTITLRIPDDIYVHQLYWTAWQKCGILQFRDDVYCTDFEIYSLLGNKF
jgi:L,D-transpeptidase YcbB